ncbi:MAG: monofunctional biosynthetic peptidoglycan transglycosylase [Flavobacteriales bacterium]|nr:monofunctional biosynthetic peptidoglycan transglycosylase [Flavobacteriales bacterium]
MRRYVLTPLKWLGATAFWCVVVSVLWVLLLGAVDPPVTWIMVQQSNEQKDFARTWKDLDEISLWMPLAVIASEDQKFMDHSGFDMEALEKAWAEYDKPKRRSKLKGASTISQQTAKNVFLWDGRTLLRKGIEAWFTLLIETFWNKERILEVYLNVAETGAGRFGAEAAAQHCFGKPAAKLTQSQAALVAVLLPSPRRYSCKKPGPFTGRRQAWVVRNINNLGNVLDPAIRKRNEKALQAKEERKARRKKKK